MSESLTYVGVTASMLINNHANGLLISNIKNLYNDLPMSDAALATSAAPTYFPAH